ncbi:MFS general substrate transporter [Suillus placidus]|uniref:MFS general substrate transporter n=1 Tax=Suillus placidus TaxID=48579 RepID=A0A9P6ZNW4_9AGAM|nr:MFS general substrate transporter [Suillus placidus]
MSLESSGVFKDQKHHAGVALSTKDVDTGAQLVAGLTSTLDPDEALRIRCVVKFHAHQTLFDFRSLTHRVQFMDKTTLGSAAILGIQLGTVFYLSYLVFEYPQNLALQRFPVGKWMSINIFVWAHCKNFAGLLVVRLLLGVCEGSITAGFLIVSSMFYTRTEQTLRVGYWFLMNGTAQIISGFISFGTLHINTKGFEPWQWLMIITGAITLVLAISFWFLFPDSPTNAWFLTPDERAKAVQRIKENQTGVENKRFKREQLIEALTDPKTWLFALFSALDNVPNSLTNQQTLILASFGFSALQTTLLSCVPGIIEILTIFTGVRLAARRPNSRAYVGAIYFVPAWLGILLVNLLPWSNQTGLLISQFLTGVSVPGFVLSLSWLNSVTAGHTKKVVTNAIMLSAYCIGNAAGPFMWKTQYKPRNHVPWAVIGACYVVCPILLLVIRAVLVRENKIRDAEPVEDEEEYVIERITEDGKCVEVKVDKEFLDLTDRQNRDFRYVL